MLKLRMLHPAAAGIQMVVCIHILLLSFGSVLVMVFPPLSALENEVKGWY